MPIFLDHHQNPPMSSGAGVRSQAPRTRSGLAALAVTVLILGVSACNRGEDVASETLAPNSTSSTSIVGSTTVVATTAPAATSAPNTSVAQTGPADGSTTTSTTPGAGTAGECTTAESPPSDNEFNAVIVTGIGLDDPDQGLNLRESPDISGEKVGVLPNGLVTGATGGCQKSADGIVWWELSDGHFGGWASTAHLSTTIPSPGCPTGAGHFGGDWVIGDFDGDGQTDTLILDGTEVYILFADGGVTSRLDLTREGFPDTFEIGTISGQNGSQLNRLNPENTNRSMGFVRLVFEQSSTGAGINIVIGASGCSPEVLLEREYRASAASRQSWYVCPGASGRDRLYEIDGSNDDGTYNVFQYNFNNNAFAAQPPYTDGNINDDVDPGC